MQPQIKHGLPRSGSLLTTGLLQLPFGLNVTIMVAVATLIGLFVLIGGLLLVHRRLARKSSMRPPAAGVYYDQRKELQYSDYHVSDRQRSRLATPMRFTGETKSLHVPPPPLSAGYRRPRPPPPPHQGPGGYIHGPSTGPLLYHAIDSGLTGADSRYVEHIYESPTSVRKDFNTQGCTGVDSLQYFEIDSEHRGPRGTGQESI